MGWWQELKYIVREQLKLIIEKHQTGFLRLIVNKTKLKLKMMEISFEQINNSRNNMIIQLAECETALQNNRNMNDKWNLVTVLTLNVLIATKN